MEKTAWSVPDLLQLAGGYWNVCTLHAGVKLGVFTQLAEGPLSAEEAAGRLQADPRGTAMLLDALAAMELLEKREGRYADTPFSAQYLSRTSEKYLGHIIMHHHHLVEGWSKLDAAVKRGKPVRERSSHDVGEEERESFLMGMFNLAMQLAPVVVPQIDLAGRKRLLDLGGGPGTYAIHFCLHNPQLQGVVYDLPTTRRFAEQTIARFGLAERIGFNDGDFIEKGIAGSYDVAWLSHILHGENPQGCAVILRKTFDALEPGGMVLVQEFILEDSRDRPLFPALFSLNMLIGTESGQSYSQGELAAMLQAAGFMNVRRIPLQLPNGAGVMAAIR